ncbi:nuclear transport factor 2 family protein [Aurantibacter sp.]|uniref:nuclear transport factor 2 family protein n=1 Tax=Aurantibacter sp. TaxID=2807103 RepID=UPI003263DE82
MYKLIFTIALLFTIGSINAQSEENEIRQALQLYIDGSSYNDPEKISEPFYEDVQMFLSKKDQPIYILSISEYASLFEKREKGKFNGRVGKILFVDQENDIALAKAEILITEENLRFIDMFILKKLEDGWKIISKAATLMPEE